MKRLFLSIALSCACLLGFAQIDGTESPMRQWALTPPMGWNSWDCYYSSVNEEITMQNARYLRDHLKEYGWEYVVVDIRWYANHPSNGGGNYNQSSPDCVLDAYGRYLPSPTRFPSAMQNGENKGFKAMADSIHAMGLKFGIHIMRGLPKYILNSPTKYALKGDASITGSKWSQVYASTTTECTWLKDNLTVRDNTYGQLYYNSIIDLYAEWGVDFIKVDDISRPFHTDEIQMLRNAIDQCGRPILLSLSPGKTQPTYAQSCLDMANQWRMMDDLWDNWSSVKAVFAEADLWQPYYRPGNYADCDMLPLGHIAMTVGDNGYCSTDNGRTTNLTKAEQRTLMTLWGACHSPLFFGGELTDNDDFTNSLLTNREYLRMHAYGMDAHQHSKQDGKIVWTSVDPESGNRYLALFNVEAGNGWIYDDKALYTSQVLAYTTDGHKEDVSIDLPAHTKSLALVWDDGGDNWNYDHGDWLNPTFISENGYEVPVTGDFIVKKYTNSYYNRINENKNVLGTGKMKVLGTSYDRGFAADANALIVVYVPDSIVGFKATAALDDSGIGQTNSTTTMRFYVFDADPRTSLTNSPVSAIAHSGVITRYNTEPKQLEADVTGATTLTIVVGDCGDGYAYDRADLVNAVLIDKDGQETPLTDLTEASYTSNWSNLHKNTNVEGGTLSINGQTYTNGLGLNAYGTLIYNLPADKNYVKFRALCGLDDSAIKDNTKTTGCTLEFMVYADNVSSAIPVNLTDFGYLANQKVAIRDIWNQTELGEYKDNEYSAEVAEHDAQLLLLTPERTGSNSVAVTATAENDSVQALTATIDGSVDDQSYVTFYIDGQWKGSQKVTGNTATYHAAGLSNGEHSVRVLYSGTAQTPACESGEVKFDVATAITHVSTDAVGKAAAQHAAGIYTLSGTQVTTPTSPGIYIENGQKRLIR